MTAVAGAVAANRKYRSLLGWDLVDLGLVERPLSDEDLVAEISTLQQQLGVEPDGICGPKTLSPALALRQARLLSATYTSLDAKLYAMGAVAVCEAKRAWLQNIVDLPARTSHDYERCRSYIDALIRTPIGINWTWEDPYLADTHGRGNFEWCGTIPALGWGAAGIKLALRVAFFASNYRLDRFARYKPLEHTPNPRPATGPHRMIIELDEDSTPAEAVFEDGSRPRPGDIMLIGGVNTGPGKHITLIEKFDASSHWVTTIEGNGTGVGPRGNAMHGIIRAQRRIGLPPGAAPTYYFVRRIIRLGGADFA